MADSTASETTGGGADRFDKHLIAGGEFLREDRIEEARGEFEAALELRPDDENALGLLGLSHFRLSSFEGALKAYEKLVEMKPNDASYRLNLGLVHLKLGDAVKAIDQLESSRELDPGQPRTVSYLGLACARAGNYAKAYEAFLRADQSALAAEMEQHLTPEQCRDIRARVVVPAAEEPDADKEIRELGEDEIEEVLVEEKDASESAPASEPAQGKRKSPRKVSKTAPPPPPPPSSPRPSLFADVEGAPAAVEGAITEAVEAAAPSSAAEARATKTAVGHQPPVSLSQFATDRLIRPDDGDHAFETCAGGALIVRVRGKIWSRTHDLVLSSGSLAFAPATRRVRGTYNDEPFGDDSVRMYAVKGEGFLVFSPAGQHFAPVNIDDGILYAREEFIFAFEEALRWESGQVPASDIRVTQFRGKGCVALRTTRPLLSVKLAADRPMRVVADRMAGWVGRVVPRLVAPSDGDQMLAPFVECSGEGVVLLFDQGGE